MVKVPIILRYLNGVEYRTVFYVTSYEWGYGEPTFVEKIRTIMSKIIRELASRGYPATICHPTINEILRGSIDRRRYATQTCADLAFRIIDKIHRELGWDP